MGLSFSPLQGAQVVVEKHPQLLRLVEIVRRLRAPGGCPWDRKQTLRSLAPYILEEGWELVEALEQEDLEKTREEVGDLLMVALMICQVAEDEGKFDLEAAAREIADKLVRRHPHVFGDAQVKDAGEVLERWEEIKKEEKARKPGTDQSALSGVPRSMPALLRALRMGEKASRLGFDWPDARSSMDKIREETAEVEEELRKGEKNGSERLFQEIGDLLFAVANAGRLLGVNPEMALRATLDRFEVRFRRMEKDLDKPIREASFEELDRAWNEAKEAIRREEGKRNGEEEGKET